jgi:hypothetical protein
MSLVAGQSLSFYEILGPLGAGGMGEVYRARDTRLDREVAIKVLPEELAGDADRLRRFEREAKALASLNHPNVAGIHGVDQAEHTYFLALELVPGEDLAARLSRGALPLEDALDVCRQLAEGLEAAHEAGVVHRDLKPANVRITPEGMVKILDFGLAKPMVAQGDGSTTAQSDSFLMTEEGVVLGTPVYMSPEQARGKPVDRRTDLWALGCVLYECLTGGRAFHGTSMPDVFASIVGGEPDWNQLPALPARLEECLRRLLVKDPRQRLRDAGEARVQLQLAAEEPLGASVQAGAAAPGSARRSVMIGALGLALGTALGAFLLGGDDGQQGGLATRPASDAGLGLQVFLHELPGGSQPRSLGLSPDARRLAWADEDGLHVRSLDAIEPRTLISESVAQCAWSPDGTELAYWEWGGEHLWRVSVEGGPPRRLAEWGQGVRIRWREPDRLLVTEWGGMAWIDVESGERREILRWKHEDEEFVHAHGAALLPGDEGAVAVLHGVGLLTNRILKVHPDGSRELMREFLGAGATETAIVDLTPEGHLLLSRGGASRGLHVLELSSDDGSLEGRSRLLIPDGDLFDLNAAGALAYGVQSKPARNQLLWIDQEGTETPFGRSHETILDADLDRADEHIAYSVRHDGAFEVWVYDLERRLATMRLRDKVSMADMALMPGGRIAISSVLGPEQGAGVIDLHTSGAPEPFSRYGIREVAPDGQTLVAINRDAPGGTRLLLVGPGDTDERPFLDPAYDEELESFSPEGDWMLYLSERTGEQQAYLAPFPPGEADRSWPVSADGADDAWFSDELDEIVFRDDDEVLAVSLQLDDEVELGRPERLFTLPENTSLEDYDGAGRFLAVRSTEAGPLKLYVDTEWKKEL